MLIFAPNLGTKVMAQVSMTVRMDSGIKAAFDALSLSLA